MRDCYKAVLPKARTESCIEALEVQVHVRRSGELMELDGSGKCVAGC